MVTFYEWLKQNKEMVAFAREIKNQYIIGSLNYPISVKDEPISLSKKECDMLIKMEKFVTTFSEISDKMFIDMLEDKHVKDFKKLSKEYPAICGGIASDLRNYGWLIIAKYIVSRRNLNAKWKKAKDRPLPGDDSSIKIKPNKNSFNPIKNSKIKKSESKDKSLIEDDFEKEL